MCRPEIPLRRERRSVSSFDLPRLRGAGRATRNDLRSFETAKKLRRLARSRADRRNKMREIPQSSLHCRAGKRQRDEDRINLENRKILVRLIEQYLLGVAICRKPTISRNKLELQYRSNLRYKRNIMQSFQSPYTSMYVVSLFLASRLPEKIIGGIRQLRQSITRFQHFPPPTLSRKLMSVRFRSIFRPLDTYPLQEGPVHRHEL